jgi:hypothetical protein
MSDQPETGAQATPPEPEQPPSLNGTIPAPPEDLAAVIGREVTLTLRAVEELNMRVMSLQVALIMCAAIAVITAAGIYKFTRGGTE